MSHPFGRSHDIDALPFPRGVPGQVNGAAASAEWTDPSDIIRDPALRFSPDKLFLGECATRPIGINDPQHLVIIAGSRSGKTSTALMPNAFTYSGSMIIIDPKGEITELTAEYRHQHGHRVIVFDPFAKTRFKSKSFDPGAELTRGDRDDIPDNVASFARSIIVAEKGREDHWVLGARNLVFGLSLYLIAISQFSLRRLRQLLIECLTVDDRSGTGVFYDMARETAFDGIISRIGEAMLAKGENEGASIISTAIEQTSFLESPKLMSISDRSDVTLDDLKKERVTIYLVLPASRMTTHARWLRIIVDLALLAAERVPDTPAQPVLFMLEEFPQLGHMKSLEAGAGLLAGFGVKLWVVLQDLSQLKAHYRDSWETFLGNAGVLQAFGNADVTTLEYLSKRLGDHSYMDVQSVHASSQSMAMGDTGRRENLRTVPLMAPFEIGQFFSRESKKQLILMPGRKPMALDRVHYSDARFKSILHERRRATR